MKRNNYYLYIAACLAILLLAAILPSGAEAAVIRSSGTSAFGSARSQPVGFTTPVPQPWPNPQPPTPAPQPPAPEPQPPVSQPLPPFTGRSFGSASSSGQTSFGSITQPQQPAPSPQPPSPAPQPPAPAPQPPQIPGSGPVTLNAQEQLLFNLVNNARTSNGLAPLQINVQLTQLARLKSQDMIRNNYFAHQSPVYGSVGDMLRGAGISFILGAENIGIGGNINSIFNAFMGSSGHRNKILGVRYTQTGIGIIHQPGRGYLVTQIFVQPR